MNIIQIVIEVLIFTALIGSIAVQVATFSSNTSNVTGASLVLIGLITIVVVAGFIMYLYRSTGLGRKMHK